MTCDYKVNGKDGEKVKIGINAPFDVLANLKLREVQKIYNEISSQPPTNKYRTWKDDGWVEDLQLIAREYATKNSITGKSTEELVELLIEAEDKKLGLK